MSEFANGVILGALIMAVSVIAGFCITIWIMESGKRDDKWKPPYI